MPAQEDEGGLVWVLWVFYIPSFKPAERNEKAEFAAVVFVPLSPLPHLQGAPCWGWGHVPVESPPGTGNPV